MTSKTVKVDVTVDVEDIDDITNDELIDEIRIRKRSDMFTKAQLQELRRIFGFKKSPSKENISLADVIKMELINDVIDRYSIEELQKRIS